MAAPLIAIAGHDPVLTRLLSHVLEDAGCESVHLPDGSSAYDEIHFTTMRAVRLEVGPVPMGVAPLSRTHPRLAKNSVAGGEMVLLSSRANCSKQTA